MSSSSKEYLQRLARVECPDSTFMDPNKTSIVFHKAKGSLVYDVQGREYLDLCAGFGSLALGHAHETIREIFRDFSQETCPQVIHAMGDVYASTDKVHFLEAMKNLLPKHMNIGGVSLSGTHAVEFALKTAFLKTKKHGVIHFEGSYHGVDLGVLPVTARKDFSDPFEPFLSTGNTKQLEFNGPLEKLEQSFNEAHEFFAESGIGLACVIVEPVQGRAGIRIPQKKWLKKLCELAHQKGALVIFDEVFVGFGRCGRISFSEEFAADICCFGKAIGGGMPLSACFSSESIMNAWPKSSGEAIHTGTFFGHPLSCRIGEKTLQVINKTNLIEKSAQDGAYFMEQLELQLSSFDCVKQIRGQALMIAIEFNSSGQGATLMELCKNQGLIVLPCGPTASAISLTPALNIGRKLIDRAVSSLKSAVAELEKTTTQE